MKNNRRELVLLSGITLSVAVACVLFSLPRGPLNFDPDALPEAQRGVPYDAKITITGNVTPAGDFSLSEGMLPDGVVLEKVEGENAAHIVGTPREAGVFNFKIFVWCYGTNVSGQVGEKEYSLIVK